MRNHDYWVYILTNKHCTSLYIGITNDLERRLYEHKHGEVEGFTKHYRLNRLVWLEHFRDVNSAIACEKRLKGWKRSRKIALIEEENPRWLDLSQDWEQQPRIQREWDTEEMIGDPLASLRMTMATILSCHVERSETSLAIVWTTSIEMIGDPSLRSG